MRRMSRVLYILSAKLFCVKDAQKSRYILKKLRIHPKYTPVRYRNLNSNVI